MPRLTAARCATSRRLRPWLRLRGSAPRCGRGALGGSGLMALGRVARPPPTRGAGLVVPVRRGRTTTLEPKRPSTGQRPAASGQRPASGPRPQDAPGETGDPGVAVVPGYGGRDGQRVRAARLRPDRSRPATSWSPARARRALRPARRLPREAVRVGLVVQCGAPCTCPRGWPPRLGRFVLPVGSSRSLSASSRPDLGHPVRGRATLREVDHGQRTGDRSPRGRATTRDL